MPGDSDRSSVGYIRRRKEYMRNIYSNYWVDARERIYGFSEYDQDLCKLPSVPKDVASLMWDVGQATHLRDICQTRNIWFTELTSQPTYL